MPDEEVKPSLEQFMQTAANATEDERVKQMLLDFAKRKSFNLNGAIIFGMAT